jgi:hypothetical protein
MTTPDLYELARLPGPPHLPLHVGDLDNHLDMLNRLIAVVLMQQSVIKTLCEAGDAHDESLGVLRAVLGSHTEALAHFGDRVDRLEEDRSE